MAGNAKRKKRIDPRIIAHGGIDIPFLILVLVLLTIGLIMMFSASYTYCYYNNQGDSLYYFKRQFFFAVFGIAAMFAASKFDINVYRRFAKPLLLVSYALLVVVLFVAPPAGIDESFHRWITIPGVTTFQPSEIAKLAIVLFLAMRIGENVVGMNKREMTTVRGIQMPLRTYCFLEYMAVVGFACILVYLENHVSGTLLIFALGLMMMWFAGFDYRIFVIGIGIVLAFAILVIMKPTILPSHAQGRITAWLDKDYDPQGTRWQTNNALYAIGSGGLFGVGLGNSQQKQLYVSEPMNDFIFSIVCEELGVIGAVVIIGLFIALVWRGFYIGIHTKDRFASVLAMGLSFQVGLQAALNIGVVTDVLPNTGISLPFFSYGGTSLLMLLFEMGMILSISRTANIKKA